MKTKNDAMKAGRRGVLALALALAPTLVLMGADLYVDAGVAASGTGTQEAPYKTIQEAIAVAEVGATIHVAAGTYDSGSTQCADGGYARVVVKKSLKIKGAGRDKSFIVGTRGSGTAGLGTGAVRCVAIEADDVEIASFTICNGYTTGSSGSDTSGNSYGGGVYSHNRANGFVVDCTIRDCCAGKGGAIACKNPDFANERLAAVRCLLTNNRTANPNFTYCDFGASLYWCVVTRHYNDSRSPVESAPHVINCTFENNYCSRYFTGCGAVCNTFAGQYAYRGGANSAGYDYFTNVYFTTVAQVRVDSSASVDCTFDGEKKQFVSPLENDLRPLPGAPLLTAGKGSLLALIPEAYRTKDYEGTTVDPSAATIAVGAIQTPYAPASGMVVASYSAVKGDSFVFGGVTNTWVGQQFYWHATNWPSFVRFKPILLSGTNEYGFAASGADTMDRFPLMDGTYLIMPPPSGTLTLTLRKAAQTFYADPSADATTADGTPENPFATLQDAADAVTSGGYAVIYAAPGVYDKGGSKIIGALTNRVALQGRHIRLVGIEGAEKTFIVGAEAPDAEVGKYGCGANATRCLCASATGAVQGFTLTGGRAGANSSDANVNRSGAVLASDCGFQVLDCIVSNNCAGLGAAGFGNVDSHLLFARSRILGNRTITSGNSGAYMLQSDVSSCLVAKNWSGSKDAPVFGSDQVEQVYDSTIYAEGENDTYSGYGASSKSGTHRNSIFAGFGAYRNIEAYNIVIDKTIRNTTRSTYVTAVTGIYTSGVDVAAFVDAANDDLRILPSSVAFGFASYDAARDVAAYRLATMSLDGVVPDFSGDGRFTAGAFRKPADCVAIVGDGISPVSYVVDPAPGAEIGISATRAYKRPFLGFEINGELQPFAGTNFTFTVPADFTGVTTITAAYDTNWYVNASIGRDNGYGTASSPLRRLCDAVTNAVSGDVVHVAPGTYSIGSAYHPTEVQEHGAAAIRSRAYIPQGVSVVSQGSAADTFIVGAEASNPAEGSFGCGTNAVRCVFMEKNTVLAGFTVTGGRVNDVTSEKTDDVSGGGILARNNTAVISDCVISNNVACRGGGGYNGTYNRCRIIGNKVVSGGNGAAVRGHGSGLPSNPSTALLNNCVVAKSHGWATFYFAALDNCTLAADNEDTSGSTVGMTLLNVCYRVCNTLILGDYGIAGTIGFSNCVFSAAMATRVGGNASVTTNACLVAATDAELAVDENFAPVIGSNIAVDAGDSSMYDASKLGELDVYGHPRAVNGSRLDVGAVEADWKPRYSTVLGRGVNVVAADPSAEEAQQGVFLPEGTMSIAWTARAGRRRSFTVSVTGTGMLVAKRGGEAFRTYTAASGVVTETFIAEAAEQTLSFEYVPGDGDTGGAYLSKFMLTAGMSVSFR